MKIVKVRDIVREYLNRIGFRFTVSEHGECVMFSGSICTKCAVIDTFLWKIAVEEKSVQSFFTLPTHVPDDRRTAVAEFCMRVNWTLRWNKLVEDLSDGELVVQTCLPATALSEDSDDELDLLIGLPMTVIELFVPGLIAVMRGGEPASAYRQCERGQDGGESRCGDKEEETAAEESETEAEVAAKPAVALSSDYSLDGLTVHGDIPLESIVAAVRKFRDARERGDDAPRMNLLLSGPSGSGKTEFVKHLGREVGAEVMTISASDVLSPLVGRTEQRLAKAFRRAREKGSILFLDEVDSLLTSRANALHSWEVTQTNELLQLMENFGGVMVGATNFESNLDSAVMRRFIFRLSFGYLTDGGKRKFFARYFKTELAPEEGRRLDAIDNLTPGDFRTARQRLFYLDGVVDNAKRLDALQFESDAKRVYRRRIGF